MRSSPPFWRPKRRSKADTEQKNRARRSILRALKNCRLAMQACNFLFLLQFFGWTKLWLSISMYQTASPVSKTSDMQYFSASTT